MIIRSIITCLTVFSILCMLTSIFCLANFKQIIIRIRSRVRPIYQLPNIFDQYWYWYRCTGIRTLEGRKHKVTGSPITQIDVTFDTEVFYTFVCDFHGDQGFENCSPFWPCLICWRSPHTMTPSSTQGCTKSGILVTGLPSKQRIGSQFLTGPFAKPANSNR